MVMNIMISAVGTGNGFAMTGGSGDGFLFVVVFSGLGLVLLAVAGCILRGCEAGSAHLVRYTEIRH